MSTSAQLAVQNRYARCPIASPKAKYSNSASIVTSATARASSAVDPHSTIPTTNGINTTAVATRFQVIEKDSPENRGLHLITSSQINHARDVLSNGNGLFLLLRAKPGLWAPDGLAERGICF